jgi:hypothetical protein
VLSVDLVGSSRISPAQVGWAVGRVGSRRVQSDRPDDQPDDQHPRQVPPLVEAEESRRRSDSGPSGRVTAGARRGRTLTARSVQAARDEGGQKTEDEISIDVV